MYNRHTDYVGIWEDDTRAVIAQAYENIASDLRAGRDPLGKSIMINQLAIESMRSEYATIKAHLLTMPAEDVNHYLYKYLVKKGAIEK